MRSALILVAGVVLGILLLVGWLQLAQVYGQPMTGPMGSMMMQMMGPQAMAEMMGQMMRDPEAMRAMAAACANAMKDPIVLRVMQETMDDPRMRQMMEQMLQMMGR